MTYRIGIDIGGTFTDFALFDDRQREIVTHKSLTTPAAPDQAVLEGVVTLTRQAGISAADVEMIVHGTTLVTNAVIERRGSPTAMIVTRGFRDVLDIAMEQRYDLFDLRIRFPEPLVPRMLRFEVDERMTTTGSVRRPLVLAALETQVRRAIAEDGVRSVAVCLLHSYANPAHELALVEWLQKNFPDAARLRFVGDLPVRARIPSLDDRVPQCLRAAGRGRLREPAGARARGGGVSRPVPDHELERQHVDAGNGAALSGAAAGVGAGGRGVDVGAAQPIPRRAAGAVVRHGRHHRQGLRGARSPSAQALRVRGRARARVQARQRAADQDPGHRHDRDRRRRRQPGRPRPAGRAARGSAQRRRRSRPCMLRAGGRRADADRRQSRPRLPRRRVVPGRPHAPRRGGGAPRAGAAAWRDRSA